MMIFSISRSCKTFRLGALFLGTLFMGACDLYEEGWTNSNRIQLQQERVFQTFAVRDVDEALVSVVARDYERHGQGDVVLGVTYDPSSSSFGAIDASAELSRIAGMFRKNGVSQLNAETMSVPDNGGQVVVSFAAYSVEAPEGCRDMPGLGDNNNLGNDPDYPLGCSIDTAFSRQIARPKDLLGGGQSPVTSDGRRITNSMESYRDGLPNTPFQGGESASEE